MTNPLVPFNPEFPLIMTILQQPEGYKKLVVDDQGKISTIAQEALSNLSHENLNNNSHIECHLILDQEFINDYFKNNESDNILIQNIEHFNTLHDPNLEDIIEKQKLRLFLSENGKSREECLTFERKLKQVFLIPGDTQKIIDLIKHSQEILGFDETLDLALLLKFSGCSNDVNFVQLLTDVPVPNNSFENLHNVSPIFVLSRLEEEDRRKLVDIIHENPEYSMDDLVSLLLLSHNHETITPLIQIIQNRKTQETGKDLINFLPLFKGFFNKPEDKKREDHKALFFLTKYFSSYLTSNSNDHSIEIRKEKLLIVADLLDELKNFRNIAINSNRPTTFGIGIMPKEGFPAYEFIHFLEEHKFKDLSVDEMKELAAGEEVSKLKDKWSTIHPVLRNNTKRADPKA